jgi:hypothetical protein
VIRASLSPTTLGRLDADQQRHLQPLPVAIDIVEADHAQPLQLGVHIKRSV